MMMKEVKFTDDPEARRLITKIARRGRSIAALHSSYTITQMDAEMDISACHANGCPLRLSELLDADDFNFAHDFFGIRRHMDRTTGNLTDCFVPRFAAKV